MKIHLDKKWQTKLSNLPETGMGSQHVDIFLKNGQVITDVPVFNGEDCETDHQFDPSDIEDILMIYRGTE